MVKPAAPQVLANPAKSMGCSSTPNCGLPSCTICSHLISPRTLFLITTTLTGSLLLHQRRDLAHQHCEAAIPDNADDLTPRIRHGCYDSVRQTIRHGREEARKGELPPVTHLDVASRPGCDGA